MKKWVFIVVGTFLMAVAYKTIYDSVGMVTGGFSGISIIVRKLSIIVREKAGWYFIAENGIPIWVTNVVLNIPLFIWGYLSKGKAFLRDTIVADACLTVFMAFLPLINVEGRYYAIAAVIGGLFAGIGVGMVFSADSTTGGTDMLASILYHKIGKLSVVGIMNIIDALIIISGMFLFGLNVSIWALLAVAITTLSAKFVISGC